MDANGSGSGLPVGFLVVGADALGACRASAVAAAKGARVIGVFDPDAAASATVASQHGAWASDNFATALRDDAVDAVVITTPHSDHFEKALLALEAGKHVFCEAPLTIRPKQGRLLASRADELQLALATGFPQRFAPPVRDARDLIANWQIGRVESVCVEFQRALSDEFFLGWRNDPARAGGGVLMDGGLAACDLIRVFLGEVIAVKGHVHSRLDLAPGCESEAYALFRDHERGFAEIRACWDAKRTGLTIEIRGTRGHLVVQTSPWRLSGKLANGRVVFRPYLRERIGEAIGARGQACGSEYVREIETFLGTIKQRRLLRTEASGWDGSRVTEMVDAIYRSDRMGFEVPVRADAPRPLGFARRRDSSRRRVA